MKHSLFSIAKAAGRRKKQRRLLSWSLLLPVGLALQPVLAQSMSLPELGDSSGAVVSAQEERRLGGEAMREIRASGAYLSDPEVNDYLNKLGQRILQANPNIRDKFEFFAVGDTTVNAFAMPGGYIGVNIGMILLTQTESELAGVMAHEIAHVTQKHYARMMDDQRKNAWMMLAGLAAAALAASKGNGDAVQGALLGSQAAQIQSYLNFSRDNEREADRVGFQYLERARFDTAGMGSMMERLQRSTVLNDTGSVPGYMRTHPVTIERIADARSRAGGSDFRLANESEDFHYVRALLRSYLGSPQEAVQYFEAALAERKFALEPAIRYGLAASLVRTRDFARAKKELLALRNGGNRNPMIVAMYAHVLIQNEEIRPAVDYLERAVQEYPDYRQFQYDLPDVLLRVNQPKRALQVTEGFLGKRGDDAELLALAARASAASGLTLKQHRYLGEQYYAQGNLPGALDQFELAAKAGQGDYFEASYVEARVRELKREIAQTAKK